MLDIDRVVAEMRAMGEALAEFSFPRVSPAEEDEISLLKSREITVDGYSLLVHYSRANDRERSLEMFQCFGRRSPFLPFVVPTQLARKFLGPDHICYVDVFLKDKKVYCFTRSVSPEGRSLPTEQKVVKEVQYEGLSLGFIDPSTVNFL